MNYFPVFFDLPLCVYACRDKCEKHLLYGKCICRSVYHVNTICFKMDYHSNNLIICQKSRYKDLFCKFVRRVT